MESLHVQDMSDAFSPSSNQNYNVRMGIVVYSFETNNNWHYATANCRFMKLIWNFITLSKTYISEYSSDYANMDEYETFKNC